MLQDFALPKPQGRGVVYLPSSEGTNPVNSDFGQGPKVTLRPQGESAQLLNCVDPYDRCSLARRTEKQRMGWELIRRERRQVKIGPTGALNLQIEAGSWVW